MTRRPAQRFVAGLLAVVAWTVLPTAASAATDPAAGAADPTVTGATLPAQVEGALSIELSKISPAAPAGASTLTINGVVRNIGATRVGRVEIGLGIGITRLTLRSHLQGSGSPGGPLVTRAVPGSGVTLTDGIDPQDYAPFRLAVPVSALSLPTGAENWGVYPLSIVATAPGSTGSTSRLTTYLPWIPQAGSPDPTRISWLWPIADLPVRDAEGGFVDDRLAGSFGPGGRLRGLVEAAAETPVTWAVDPDLLESAAVMAGGYRVRSGAGTITGRGEQAAAEWLDRLRAAIGDSDVVSLPYADVDVTALRRAGLVADLRMAMSTGGQAARAVLGRDVTIDVAWPPGDLTDKATLTALFDAGQRGIILADSALPPVKRPNYTVDGRAPLRTESGALDAMLIDTSLSAVLAGDGNSPGAGPLMIQRFLAEAALITIERPNDSRSLVVAAPRYSSLDPQVAAQLLDVVAGTPWLSSVPLSALREADPPELTRTVARYPRQARAAELPASHLSEVKRSRTQLLRFTAILAGPGEVTDAYSKARLRAESAAWRDDGRQDAVTEARRGYLRRLTADLRRLRAEVGMVPGGTVTLSSHTGTIPVTVRNELPQAVEVQVFLESSRQDRLQVDQPDIITVPAGGVAPVSVRARAVANGLVEVRVQLRNSDGDPISSWQPIKVQVTNYGTLGAVIVAGATALLFASATVRILRRSMARRRGREAAVAIAHARRVEPAKVEKVDV